MSAPPLLELEHVSVQRGAKLALDDVSLTIQAGEHVAILGPNGSGKSSLLKLINRELYPLLRPATRLRIAGRERWNVFELRRWLGVVSNELLAASVRPVTGLDLAVSGFFASIGITPSQHTVTPDMEARAVRALDRIEASHLAGREMTEMSSGEQRRVLIARALVHEPRALLLDEPGNSLDLRALYDLCESLSRLAREGTGIILVTHHLPEIIPEIDRVVYLKDGRIDADGPRTELLRPARLSKLFNVPEALVR